MIGKSTASVRWTPRPSACGEAKGRRSGPFLRAAWLIRFRAFRFKRTKLRRDRSSDPHFHSAATRNKPFCEDEASACTLACALAMS